MAMEMCGSRRMERLWSATSRETGETVFSSSSDRWADISDADSETESLVCEETLGLPVPLPATSYSSKSVCQKPADGRSERVETDNGLNAYAAEFVPTLSMTCPLMGVCTVIAEGDEDFSYFSQHHSTSELCAPFDEADSQSHASNSTNSYWKKKRPAALNKKTFVQQERTPLNDVRVEKRVESINVGKQTKEYQWQMEQINLYGIGSEPLTPSPFDESLSTRGWKAAVEAWRKELKHRYERHLAEHRLEGLSVASTDADEVHGSESKSEADESITTNGDDASSACSR